MPYIAACTVLHLMSAIIILIDVRSKSPSFPRWVAAILLTVSAIAIAAYSYVALKG